MKNWAFVFPNGICRTLSCDFESWMRMCGLYFQQSKPTVASFQLKFLCRCVSGSLHYLEDSPSLRFNLHIRPRFREGSWEVHECTISSLFPPSFAGWKACALSCAYMLPHVIFILLFVEMPFWVKNSSDVLGLGSSGRHWTPDAL